MYKINQFACYYYYYFAILFMRYFIQILLFPGEMGPWWEENHRGTFVSHLFMALFFLTPSCLPLWLLCYLYCQKH